MIRKTLVNITEKIGLYQYFVKIGTNMIHKKLRRQLKKHGLEALIQADKALKSVDSFCFLAFGTLLGAYREKNFITHDCDLDVGIFAEDIPSNMQEILLEYGFKPLRQYYIKEIDRNVVETYTYKGVSIDFFLYFPDRENLYCYFAKAHETLPPEKANKTNGFPTGVSWSKNEGFSEMEFLGYHFRVPNNAEQWLIDSYGKHFMQPKKNWIASDNIAEETLNMKYIDKRMYRREL